MSYDKLEQVILTNSIDFINFGYDAVYRNGISERTAASIKSVNTIYVIVVP